MRESMGKGVNYRVQLPVWFTRFYPEAFWRLSNNEKEVYLTFDDGPVPGVTTSVLSILNNFGIKGTFFCVGENVEKYPEIFQQILNEGHSVGNHTFNHIHGLKNTNATYFANVEKADQLIKSNLFRPPYGLLKGSQYWMLKTTFKIVMWDVISCDYDSNLKPKDCVHNVINHVRDGSIITFHDSYKAEKNILKALPIIIENLLKEGYTFKKIEFTQTRPTDTSHLLHPLQKMRDSFMRHWRRA